MPVAARPQPLRASFVAPLCAAAASLLPIFTANAQFQVLARSGDVAPGVPGQTFAGGFIPVTGGPQMVMDATVQNGTGGVWLSTPSGFQLITLFQNGFPPPGQFYYFPVLYDGVQDNGDFIFSGMRRASGSSSTFAGVFDWSAGTISTVALDQTQVPGLPAGAIYTGVANNGAIVTSGNGRTLFGSSLTGTGVNSSNSYALFTAGPGGVSMLARSGDQAPGTAAQFTILRTISLTQTGHAVIEGSTTSGGGGIWTGTAGALNPLALSGGPAVGLPGQTYLQILHSHATRAGTLGLWGLLNGTLPANAALNQGAWVVDPGDQMHLVARTGEQIVNRPGTYLRTMTSLNAVTDLGVALIGGTTGTSPNDSVSALTITTPAGLRVIARQGDAAPGTSTTFASLTLDGTNAVATMNNAGVVAFWTRLTSDGQFGSSVYSYSEALGLQRVLGTGDTVTLAPGVVRTVQSVFIGSDAGSIGAYGFASGLLDNGTLFISAQFTDGTRALLSRAVPVPGATSLLAITLGAHARRRSRPRL